MTNKEIEENRIVQLCYNHLDKFTEIYPENSSETNEMPENVKLTIYYKGTNEEGFVINKTYDELGFEALIARKFIKHSELEKLIGYPIE